MWLGRCWERERPMYLFCRLLLILAFLCAIICVVMLGIRSGPWMLIAIAGLWAYIARFRNYLWSAFAEVAHASPSGRAKAGILDAKQGMLIGYMQDDAGSLAGAVGWLWNPWISSRQA